MNFFSFLFCQHLLNIFSVWDELDQGSVFWPLSKYVKGLIGVFWICLGRVIFFCVCVSLAVSQWCLVYHVDPSLPSHTLCKGVVYAGEAGLFLFHSCGFPPGGCMCVCVCMSDVVVWEYSHEIIMSVAFQTDTLCKILTHALPHLPAFLPSLWLLVLSLSRLHSF